MSLDGVKIINVGFKQANPTDNQLLNVLADATYASAYWCAYIKSSISPKKLVGDYREDKWLDCLKRGGTLTVFDVEDAIDPAPITYQQLINGYKKALTIGTFMYESQRDGSFADAVLQIAAFGDVIFG